MEAGTDHSAFGNGIADGDGDDDGFGEGVEDNPFGGDGGEDNPFGDGGGFGDFPESFDLGGEGDQLGDASSTDEPSNQELSDGSMFGQEVSEPSVSSGMPADGDDPADDISISSFLPGGRNAEESDDGDRTEFMTELMVDEVGELTPPAVLPPRSSSSMPPIPDGEAEEREETLFMMPQGADGSEFGDFGSIGGLDQDEAFDLGDGADAEAFAPLPDESGLSQDDAPQEELSSFIDDAVMGEIADPNDTSGNDADAFSMDELATDMSSISAISDSSSAGGSDFMDDLDEFDDLGSLPDFSLTNANAEFAGEDDGFSLGDGAGSISNLAGTGDNEIFNIAGGSAPEELLSFDQPESRAAEPVVTTEGSLLAPFDNARLNTKQVVTSMAAGLVATLSVSGMAYLGMSFAKDQGANGDTIGEIRNIGLFSAIVAGLSSGGVAWFLGRRASRQFDQSAVDLQVQFDSVCQGNLSATAKVFGDDEFGDLANGFNQMMRVISSTMGEAQRKAQEQEQAREDLQRQVIRLLDDVEGAARGDLTVQAEVTADVLGAVADSFNLTIQNLREIVQQVKSAARKVNEGSSENEAFARALSSDALRQAEELAVTLNSVQVMTDSIQRVAESAAEAEEVARSASSTALKGGEAVERTVAGILQIRETVAETTRKVKRLAESSQEISKIVALISTIASRTNLLALNASIEAARAGEAGKGFAIVADEVRQLADRSAKSLKEIEKIVMQIQGETSSVMTAMEEGTQQVIEGTKLAEQAKRSLDDIIQVSNRIDVLVRSITADTVEQTETSKSVAQVVRSVEKTAQDTSHEAQRVSGSLQSLVGVARDLLTSVERFRVE
ncbi:MAG: methyl-accepting chemotaxis protein [Cyanobacteria bacterium P01_F01_bin.153]